MTLSTDYVTSESVASGAAIKKDARPVIRTGIPVASRYGMAVAGMESGAIGPVVPRRC